MYTQVENSKENKSRAIADSVGQKKNNSKQNFEFVDNRPEAINQRIMQRNTSHKELIERLNIKGKDKNIQRMAVAADNNLNAIATSPFGQILTMLGIKHPVQQVI